MYPSAKEFNKKFRIGSNFMIIGGDGRVFPTRSKAIEHSCGVPQVWLSGRVGSIDISLLHPLKSPTTPIDDLRNHMGAPSARGLPPGSTSSE